MNNKKVVIAAKKAEVKGRSGAEGKLSFKDSRTR